MNLRGRPSVRWFRSGSDEQFAEAAMRCKHPFAICIEDVFCHYGDCFSRPKPDRLDAIERRLDRIEAALNGRPGGDKEAT